MKLTTNVLTIIFILISCNQNSSTTNTKKMVTVTVLTDPLELKGVNDKSKRKIVEDSLVLYSDSLYTDLELNLIEISKNDFQSYNRKYKTECVLDSGQFISGSDLYVSQDCNEICESYLGEKTTNRKMFMPSNYDAGILTMLLSPACNQLIVCSSYDGPDYVNYYSDRAQIFVLNVTTGIGLKGITPKFKYYTKDWSIENLTWVNNKTIAMKIYEGNRGADGSDVRYKYFKADINK